MQHRIRVGGDRLVFSAAHFILLEGGVCEPLHGHNYRVAAEIAGPLNDVSCVADFLAVENALRAVLDELDHRVLVATEQTAIQTTTTETEVELRFGPRRWVFPKADCCLLPLPSTTAELLAGHVGRRLVEKLAAAGIPPPENVRVEIEESPGRTAACDLRESRDGAADARG
jgi:6-pyruvoyltetrahydropterin/6-carboxytetrahydropterin synthase